MAYKAYIFDLDGTLLDTAGDLVRLTNMVMREFGWPEHTRAEILSYVGAGGHVLLRRAAPKDAPEQLVDAAYERWQELYPAYGHAYTQPYAGIPDMLKQLQGRNCKLGVLSNKFDAAVKNVVSQHFPGVFQVVYGECEQVPRKPDPAGLRRMLEELQVEAVDVAYVGDSGTDMQTAKQVDVFAVGALWGYRDIDELRACGADTIIYNPIELLEL